MRKKIPLSRSRKQKNPLSRQGIITISWTCLYPIDCSIAAVYLNTLIPEPAETQANCFILKSTAYRLYNRPFTPLLMRVARGLPDTKSKMAAAITSYVMFFFRQGFSPMISDCITAKLLLFVSKDKNHRELVNNIHSSRDAHQEDCAI